MTTRERELLDAAIICDSTFPYMSDPAREIRPHREAGFTYVSITAAIDDAAWPTLALRRLARERHYYSQHEDEFIVVETAADIRRAKHEEKLAIGFHFQGTEAIGRDLSLVGAYYKLGVRWMLMAYNARNNAGTGCIEGEARDDGLSDFGRALIAEMNRVGMIVDVSHTGYRTAMEAIEASTKPAIFSHSNVRALFDHPRNIRDDQIRAAAESGGFVGVTGVGAFVGEPAGVTAETVFRHLDHVVSLVGPAHAALGLDYMSPACCAHVLDLMGGNLARVGMPEPPWTFLHPSSVPELVALMFDHGYAEADIRAILGDNFLRVAEAVWA